MRPSSETPELSSSDDSDDDDAAESTQAERHNGDKRQRIALELVSRAVRMIFTELDTLSSIHSNHRKGTKRVERSKRKLRRVVGK